MMMVRYLKEHQSIGSVPGRTTSIKEAANRIVDVDELIEAQMAEDDDEEKKNCSLEDSVFSTNGKVKRGDL